MSVLECHDVTAGYAERNPCLRGVELTVEAGAITCLLGPNGAGKTTLLLALSGMAPRYGGRVVVSGNELRAGRPRDAIETGMVLVPDDRCLFRKLTTEQNLRLAVRGRSGRQRRIDEIVDRFPSLRRRLTVPAGRLSGGEQQMLAIGRALLQDPSVLLVDELSMGLAPVIVDEILSVLRDLADSQGLAVLLVEQHVHLALGVADRAAVLSHGSIVLDDEADALRADVGRLERAYLG